MTGRGWGALEANPAGGCTARGGAVLGEAGAVSTRASFGREASAGVCGPVSYQSAARLTRPERLPTITG